MPSTQTDIETGESPADPPATGAELEELREDLARISPTTFVPVNRDVTAAAVLVIGAAPEVRRFRAEMVAQFGEEKASRVDRLETIARAAAAAHAQHQWLSAGEDLVPIGAAVAEARANLVTEVEALISRKRLAKGALARLQRAHGYRNLIADVNLLVSILRLSWPTISGATGLKLADLHRAEGLANELATAVGLRDAAAATPSGELRQRAYTLLVRTYDGVRRMITYIRWDEGDADRIAPSIYAGRGRRRRLGEPAREPGADGAGSDVAAPGDAGLLGGNPFPNA